MLRLLINHKKFLAMLTCSGKVMAGDVKVNGEANTSNERDDIDVEGFGKEPKKRHTQRS